MMTVEEAEAECERLYNKLYNHFDPDFPPENRIETKKAYSEAIKRLNFLRANPTQQLCTIAKELNDE